MLGFQVPGNRVHKHQEGNNNSSARTDARRHKVDGIATQEEQLQKRFHVSDMVAAIGKPEKQACGKIKRKGGGSDRGQWDGADAHL